MYFLNIELLGIKEKKKTHRIRQKKRVIGGIKSSTFGSKLVIAFMPCTNKTIEIPLLRDGQMDYLHRHWHNAFWL